MEGTVKWYNWKKGYGFVAGEDGNEYFVHHTQLSGGDRIKENDKVSFDAAETEKGKQAQNVKLISSAEEGAPTEETTEASEATEEAPAEETAEEEPEADESKDTEDF